MVDFINLLTFLWLGYWAFLSLNSIAKGKNHSILFVILIHFIYFGTPLFLDLTVGQPEYSSFPGFYTATRDELTSYLYCLYVSICPIIWWKFGRNRINGVNKSQHIRTGSELNIIFRVFLYVILFIPLGLVLFSPNPSAYLDYAAVALGRYSLELLVYHQVVAVFCMLAILSSALLLIYSNKISPIKFFIIFLSILINIFIFGKRSILAITLTILSYVYWHKGLLRGWKLFFAAVLGFLVMATFSYTYQNSVRVEYTSFSEESYDTSRIDYCRDDRLKMAIYAELYPDEMKILEYRGQSILFDLTIFISRESWENKPWPYAVYFTSALYNLPVTDLGWGMTTSWLDEAVANFSWFGFLLGPLLFIFICRFGDQLIIGKFRILTILVSILLMSLQAVAFTPLILLWIIIILKNRLISILHSSSRKGGVIT